MKTNHLTRRDFIKASALAGGALSAIGPVEAQAAVRVVLLADGDPRPAVSRQLPDLTPAQWIWYPSGRCLQNTFVLFRRSLSLNAAPRRATGWIFADSRYLLTVDGKRVQWGPAPADPRWPEADPLDLSSLFTAGDHIVGAQVLYYGQGDGTWPMGKPGFLFYLEIEHADGRIEKIVSDETWRAQLTRAWKPGHYKRWYLRSLQEEFDARLYPYGWNEAAYRTDRHWLPAMPLAGSPNKPAVCTGYYEYQTDIQGDDRNMELRPRSIPMLRENWVPALRLTESAWLDWSRSPEEYFECRTPNAFREERKPAAVETQPGQWRVILPPSNPMSDDPPLARGAVLTFEFAGQSVGWPAFTVTAPAGTVIELLVHEAHRAGGPVLINSHFDSWTRFICREGENRFETFDYESCRWLQLHMHGGVGEVTVKQVGMRRRQFPWPNTSAIQCDEPALQRLFDATVNTLHNCAQETLVDGMGRERQQYSGDCGHQLHAIYAAFGETRLPARYLATFSQGLTLDGFFLDCWPAYDRLARLMERQLQLTGWGPLLDHGVGFNFDCWHHYLYTGDLEALREPYPRLLRFADYLHRIQGPNGLLPVEGIGIPSVWIDHNAYRKTRHKQCAFNLYAAAMLERALAPLCEAFQEREKALAARQFGKELLRASVKHFWSPGHKLFINNLPWLVEEQQPRHCDRSLATAVLFDQCPRNDASACVRMLVECPPEMGLSYPANAGWRMWALAKGGNAEVVLKELRERWAAMDSVRINNTLQEDWTAKPDSGSQWSHCPVAPLFVTYMSLAGIRPLSPGFKRCEIRPQLGDLKRLELTVQTVNGPLGFKSAGLKGDRQLTLSTPAGCAAELVVAGEEKLDLTPVATSPPSALMRYAIPEGKSVELSLKHT